MFYVEKKKLWLVFKTIAKGAIGFYIYLMLFSCAQVVAPGGGKKDITPPKAIKYIPDSASINFKSKEIEIGFDEYIQLKDLNNQLIVSPPTSAPPEISVKNKSVSIVFDKYEKLKENTTYFISFGNSIQDITENNLKDGLCYVFSTGSFIDSLSIKGKVENAYDHKTEKGILIMLYNSSDDSIVCKTQPDYFSKTNEDGRFIINNVRDGKFKMVALKDNNANYKYDEGESIGYIDGVVNSMEKKTYNLDMFEENSKQIYLKKFIHDSYGKISMVFNHGSDSIKIINTNTEKNIQEYFEFSKNRDTLNYWFVNYQKDSIKLIVKNGTKILDTLSFKCIKREDALKARKNQLKLLVVGSPNGNQNVDINRSPLLSFNHPIKEIGTSKFFLEKRDSIYVNSYSFCPHNNKSSRFIELSGCNLKILENKSEMQKEEIATMKENVTYDLLILPNQITDIFNLTNDTISLSFKTREQDFYGNLNLKINLRDNQTNYILQLLDEKEKLVTEKTIIQSQTIQYKYLYPGKYKFKIIIDQNKNGIWDTGNYFKHIQAEEIIYNNEEITIRSNWDIDLVWDVSKLN